MQENRLCHRLSTSILVRLNGTENTFIHGAIMDISLQGFRILSEPGAILHSGNLQIQKLPRKLSYLSYAVFPLMSYEIRWKKDYSPKLMMAGCSILEKSLDMSYFLEELIFHLRFPSNHRRNKI